jgi:hypothetical protein
LNKHLSNQLVPDLGGPATNISGNFGLAAFAYNLLSNNSSNLSSGKAAGASADVHIAQNAAGFLE